MTVPDISGAARFVIATPALSRGTADRSDDLRNPGRLDARWPSSRVIILDHAGRVELDEITGRLRTHPTAGVAGSPPAQAVLLGSVDGVDHWAVPGTVRAGTGLRDLGPLLSDTDAGVLTTATALLTWHDTGCW